MALASYNYTLIGGGTAYEITCNNRAEATEAIIPISYNGLPVTSIGDYAFSDCSKLTSVIIGNRVTSVGYGAFRSCRSLMSIIIPDSVTSIGDGTFVNCSSLTSIIIPDSVTSIGNSTFSSCSGLTSVTIGGSVTSVGVDAFSGCSGLTSIEIPDSVTSIGSYAFVNCSGLTGITVKSITPPILGANAFNGTNCPIYVPKQSVEAYKTATNWNTYSSRIQVKLKKIIDFEALEVYDEKVKEYSDNKFVQKSTTIAGVDLQDNITANELKNALNVSSTLSGSSVPTTATAGALGQVYIDTTNHIPYMCVDIDNGTYTWVAIAAVSLDYSSTN